MLLRQRIGIASMILFMPVNSPVWRMGIDEMGFDIGLSEVGFFTTSVFIFIVGSILTFTPKTIFD
ncbi:MAG: hypothetical protein CMA71_00185 [Euryarchaeota archaeon]|nr:hypothetical protein [Euryarchaeota archaeon]DAC42313.1 MAG TPA: hypothetical protein D7H72_05660 [Candidatus Poseidoniales archaeon]